MYAIQIYTHGKEYNYVGYSTVLYRNIIMDSGQYNDNSAAYFHKRYTLIIINNNNRVYTPLSEKCSQSRVFTMYITVPYNSHSTILCVLPNMVHVALRQITAQYQIQISDENRCIHSNTDRVTNITVE